MVCDFFNPGEFLYSGFYLLSAFNQIIYNMVNMPGRRTRNNSSVLIESIRLKTCLFIPARVRPSPTENAPSSLSCAFRLQTEHCILFYEKKNQQYRLPSCTTLIHASNIYICIHFF